MSGWPLLVCGPSLQSATDFLACSCRRLQPTPAANPCSRASSLPSLTLVPIITFTTQCTCCCRIGVHSGVLAPSSGTSVNKATHRVMYQGEALIVAKAVMEVAHGGEPLPIQAMHQQPRPQTAATYSINPKSVA